MVELDRQLARFEKLPEPSEAESARLGAMIFDGGRIEALVAERDGRVEGMAIFWEGLGSSFRARPFLFLEDLVVSESARSVGIGDALMRSLAREGVRRGVMRLEWSVLDWNVDAIRFYRRIGAGAAAGLGPLRAEGRRDAQPGGEMSSWFRVSSLELCDGQASRSDN
jgi:GNAT superfamily N-acetyltransferase